MKRWNLVTALACAVCLAAPGAAGALGVCLEASDSCNDYYLEVAPEAGSIYRLHGYEYGCGSTDDLVSGTLRISDGVAHIGILGSAGSAFDTGAVYQRNYVIETLTQDGTYEYLYMYLDNGFIRYSGGDGTAILFICSDPGAPAQERLEKWLDPDARP